MNVRALIIEDEKEIREYIVSQFIETGFEAMGLDSGLEVLSVLKKFSPDIVLLDQMMPGKSGKEVIREIRNCNGYSELPIMMVTGLDGEDEKIAALESGADDYVTKPFSIREVIARANALVRRSHNRGNGQPERLTSGGLTIDLKAHKALLNDFELQLTLTEFRILSELVRHVGQVLTRDSLRERALGNLNVTDRTIDVHMASLRKKLELTGERIETVRGVGYRFSAE